MISAWPWARRGGAQSTMLPSAAIHRAVFRSIIERPSLRQLTSIDPSSREHRPSSSVRLFSQVGRGDGWLVKTALLAPLRSLHRLPALSGPPTTFHSEPDAPMNL